MEKQSVTVQIMCARSIFRGKAALERLAKLGLACELLQVDISQAIRLAIGLNTCMRLLSY